MSNQEVLDLRSELKKAAQEAASLESRASNWLSIRGGILRAGLNDDAPALPGNRAACVVLGAVWEYTYYDKPFDSANPAPPVCYAVGQNQRDMSPHPRMQEAPDYFVPQNKGPSGEVLACQGCPKSVFGSAVNGRKGRACTQRKVLAVIPAGMYVPQGDDGFKLELQLDPQHYASADVAMLRVPVTSVKLWQTYVQTLASTYGVPPYAAATRIHVKPDPKTQVSVEFSRIDALSDDVIRVCMQRANDLAASGVLERGFDPPQ